ncbi:hypothetical protein B0H10DRAFT_2081338 [Mycena sp. CBHHK59/15]|nr:hypothetical protein B0H10DRAFT_2081338 [Mycena sp. CBHHK59/15]
MSSNFFAKFACLDELVQVIYQGMNKFVVLSDVSDDNWTIHLADILAIVGSKSSDTLLEAFAQKLANSIVHGELHVEEGAQYKLTLGPTAKTPMHVTLEEMCAPEAAAYATDVFVGIALQAQSRQSRLNLSAVPLVTSSAPSRAPPSSKPTTSKATKAADASDMDDDVKPVVSTRSSGKNTDKKAQDEIKALKAELVKQKQRRGSPEETTTKPAAVAPRPLKGASLANPNKKARKYQAIEFESDDD